jgi:hypothetical protein
MHPTRVLRMIIQETTLVPDSFPLAIFSYGLWDATCKEHYDKVAWRYAVVWH